MLKNVCFDDGYELKVALETQLFPYASEMLKSKSTFTRSSSIGKPCD